MKLYALRGKKLNVFSKELAAAVAKSDRENGNDWLPFWMHSFDTAGIMEKLAQKRLPESISDYLCAECGGREKLFSTLKFCALVHDIGKVTVVFSHVYVTRLSSPPLRNTLIFRNRAVLKGFPKRPMRLQARRYF